VEAVLHQFLDQLGARGLVLDQHDSGFKGAGLLAPRLLPAGVNGRVGLAPTGKRRLVTAHVES
jgi:hypothetical protein